MGHLQQQLHISYVDSKRKTTQTHRSKQGGDWSTGWRFRGSKPSGKNHFFLEYFQASATLQGDLSSFFGFLRSVQWQSLTDVAGQPIDHMFKGQAVKMGPICYLEKSVRIYHHTQGKNPQNN